MKTFNIYTTIVIALAVACLQVTASKKEFVATNEWQVVEEGQAIPKGLHVRINLQTGVKEAKLLDENEGSTALQSQPDDDEQRSEREPLSLEHKADIIEESIREHRDYAELRKAYKEFQKNFRTDDELIGHILEQYRNFSRTPVKTELNPKLNALENLEYLLHQIDNALTFINNGGLDDILLPIVVNETDTHLRISAMRILGALALNNPKAQIKVYERNFGSHLSQILMKSTNNAEVSSALHALGALLRKFPMAQQSVLATLGMQALIGVLRSSDIELRNKAKVVTLISDLVLEKRYVVENQKDFSKAKVEQYSPLEFESWLKAHEYCTTVEAVLSKSYMHLLDLPEIVEQFTVALDSTSSLCTTVWPKSADLRHALLTLRNNYGRSQDEYRLEVSQAVARICEQLYESQISPPHTEL